MKPLVGVPGVDFTVEDVRGAFPDELVIKPFEGPVDATIRVPGSKSITNRALIIGALADGTSTIENPLFSDDPYWLMAALTGLGLPTKADRGTGTVIVKGQRGIIPKSGVEVFVGNAGTAARFLPPVLALGEGPYLVDGVARMRERPVGDLVEAMKGLGARVGYAGEEGRFPIEVGGGGYRGAGGWGEGDQEQPVFERSAHGRALRRGAGGVGGRRGACQQALHRHHARGDEGLRGRGSGRGARQVCGAAGRLQSWEVCGRARRFGGLVLLRGGGPDWGEGKGAGTRGLFFSGGSRLRRGARRDGVRGGDRGELHRGAGTRATAGGRGGYERDLGYDDHTRGDSAFRILTNHDKERGPYPDTGDRPHSRRRSGTHPARDPGRRIS